MSLASAVGLSDIGKSTLAKIEKDLPGLEEILKARETQFLETFQPTIDQVKQTIAAVKADVIEAKALITSINTSIVPGVAAVLETIERLAARIEQIAGRTEAAAAAFAKVFGADTVSNVRGE